jgi:hypothetical protein
MTPPTLIYCAGKNPTLDSIALEAGFHLGAQLPCTTYYPLYFADQDWRQPGRAAYMEALAQHRPHLATDLDWEQEDQLPEVLAWAEEAAQHANEILVIPKVIDGIARLPRRIGNKPVRLAYSVPTRFAGTPVPLWEFTGWPVHLLGGSPHKQMEIARYLNVKSADGNMLNNLAHRGLLWRQEKGPSGHWWSLPQADGQPWPHGNANREAFRRSCRNIMKAWRQAA